MRLVNSRELGRNYKATALLRQSTQAGLCSGRVTHTPDAKGAQEDTPQGRGKSTRYAPRGSRPRHSVALRLYPGGRRPRSGVQAESHIWLLGKARSHGDGIRSQDFLPHFIF